MTTGRCICMEQAQSGEPRTQFCFMPCEAQKQIMKAKFEENKLLWEQYMEEINTLPFEEQKKWLRKEKDIPNLPVKSETYSTYDLAGFQVKLEDKEFCNRWGKLKQ